ENLGRNAPAVVFHLDHDLAVGWARADVDGHDGCGRVSRILEEIEERFAQLVATAHRDGAWIAGDRPGHAIAGAHLLETRNVAHDRPDIDGFRSAAIFRR